MDTKSNSGSVEKPKAESVADQIVAVGKTVIDKAQEAVEKTQEAVDKAQQEGAKLFDSIAKEGERVREQTQRLAEDKFEEAKGKFKEVKEKAVDSWDNLEQIFEDRVSRVLNRLGIPSSEDFQTIAKRLDALNESVKSLITSQSTERGAPIRASGEVDDLKAITGVGPALESKLKAAGIHSYRQIATMTAEEIEHIETKVIHSSGRIARDNWILQAKELHLKKYNEQV